MRTRNRYAQTEESVLLAWRALLEEAQDKQWLAGLLARRGVQIFRRFVHVYHRLYSLPRRMRRALSAQLRRRLAATLLGAALLFALQPVPGVRAATIVVDGTCTLEDAVTAANTDSATGDCDTGSGPDIIDLQIDVALGDELPTITSDITIEGSGHAITGPGEARVLEVNGGNLTLNEATITGGEVDQDTDIDEFYRVGGGIYNYDGTVIVNNSTITGNSALYGGGLFNYGDATMTINSSTVSGNSAIDDGTYGGFGGGIYNGATLTINNSTISGNNADDRGGAIADTQTITVNNSTITGNASGEGGGIHTHTSTVALNRSIISGNTATTSGDEVWASSSGATITADNFNVIGYGGDARSEGFTPTGSDIIPSGDLSTILDDTLYDNGGPTETHALVSGSPALDVAPDGDCIGSPINDVDQRGEGRNSDGDGAGTTGNECDAGAFELQGDPTAVQLRSISAASGAGGGLAVLSSLLLALGSAGYWLRARLLGSQRP